MPWITVSHLNGKVYIPEKSRSNQAKHCCPDCFTCQQCSDERCNACRFEKKADNDLNE